MANGRSEEKKEKKETGGSERKIISFEDLRNIFAQPSLAVYHLRGRPEKTEECGSAFAICKGRLKREKRSVEREEEKKVFVAVKTRDYGLFADLLTFLTILLAINTPDRGQNMTRQTPSCAFSFPHWARSKFPCFREHCCP